MVLDYTRMTETGFYPSSSPPSLVGLKKTPTLGAEQHSDRLAGAVAVNLTMHYQCFSGARLMLL
jgi:hypothetical protein